MVGVVAGVLAVAGCGRKAENAAAPATSASPAAASGMTTFPIKGKIVSVAPKDGSVDLDADAVPGFMGAMTMTYKLHDPSVISELHPGDMITATLLVHKTSDGYEDPQLDQIVVTAQAKPDYKPAVQYHIPSVGDTVPNFALTNENGRTIHMDQFHGKVVLLTFIYTRCPLADYCPKMSRNFADINEALKKDPKLFDETHLLSISFDPTYDTPKVLKSYGGAYTGEYTKSQFTHWDFAVPPEKELQSVLEWFGVGVTPGENNTLAHSLSTAIVGKDGKVLAWYPANEWTPAEALGVVRSAA